MGIYVYGLRKHTVHHPLLGEVGVFRYLHKPANWSDLKGERLDNLRIGKVKALWRGRELPKYVMYERDTTDTVYRYTGRSPVWKDCDEQYMTCVIKDGKLSGLDCLVSA